MTQLQGQLRDAAEREARRGPVRRAVRSGAAPAIAVIALALLATGVIAAAAWLRGGDPAPADHPGPRVLRSVSIGTQGGQLATGFGAVWAADPAGSVLRLDPRTARVVARVPVGAETPVVNAGAGAVWALGADGALRRIDPDAGRVVARIPLGLPARTLGDVMVSDDGAVWVATGVTLIRIDTERNRVDRRVDLTRNDLEPLSGVSDGRTLFALGRDGLLVSYDASTGRRLGSVRPAVQGFTAAAVDNRVMMLADGGVAAVDAGDGHVLWQRPLGVERFNWTLLDGRTLWVQGTPQAGGRDRLWRLDTATGRVLGSLTLPEFGATGMAAVDGRLWLATPGGHILIVG